MTEPIYKEDRRFTNIDEDTSTIITKPQTKQVRVKLHNDQKEFAVLEQGDWIDLATNEGVQMKAGDFKLIPFDVSIELPEGYEAHVSPRSSTFERYGILQANGIGVIDNSYSGDGDIWKFPAYATRHIFIPKGTRIAQFRIYEKQPVLKFKYVESLGNEDRGGFGSTGL